MVTVTRTEKKERTRARLLEAAAKVFAAKGYFGAAVDDVAEAAGLTKGAVYAHFRTKEALYLALTIERGRRQLDEARRGLGAASSPEEKINWAADRFVEAIADRGRMAIEFEFFPYAARDPKLRRIVRQFDQRGAEVNAKFFEDLWRELGLTPRITATEFHQLISGLGMELAKDALLDPKVDLSETGRRLFRFLFDVTSSPMAPSTQSRSAPPKSGPSR